MDFLTKPINPDGLIAAISPAFERDRLTLAGCAHIAALRDRFYLLSQRERDILPLLVKGLLNKQSAAVLGIADVTLQVHRSRIMQKMLAGCCADLIGMDEKLRIIDCRNLS